MSGHLLVVGSGTAAISGALRILDRGWKVTMFHDGLPLGGTCLHVGCVPSKFMIRAAESVHRANHSTFEGIRPRGADVDFARVVKDQTALISTLQRTNYAEPLPQREGLTIVDARARMVGPHAVDSGPHGVFEGDAVLLAMGSKTYVPPIKGLEGTPYLTNENGFHLTEPPESCIVLGGGYIALEYAQMLARFGTRVTVLQRGKHLLGRQPRYLTSAIEEALCTEGLKIRTSTHFERVEYDAANGFRVHAAEEVFEAPALFVGTGREGQTQDMGLKEIGVTLHGNGFVHADAFLETDVPGVYAAGDVLGGSMFVYTASQEAERAVDHISGLPRSPIDYSGLPWVVFTDPQVAGVGLDEDHALEKGFDIDSAELPVARWPRFRVAGISHGFLRLIRDRQTGLLLGARAVCPEAGDLMTELGRVIRHRIPVQTLADEFSPYLTLSEGIQRAAARFEAL